MVAMVTALAAFTARPVAAFWTLGALMTTGPPDFFELLRLRDGRLGF